MTAVPEVQAQAPAVRPLRIRAGKRGLFVELREVWAYRELLGFLVWRDIKVRYVQTVLGPLWAIFVPLIQMVLLTVIFGHLAGIKGEYHVPYPLFVFAGLLPWMYFAASLTQSSLRISACAAISSILFRPELP